MVGIILPITLHLEPWLLWGSGQVQQRQINLARIKCLRQLLWAAGTTRQRFPGGVTGTAADGVLSIWRIKNPLRQNMILPEKSIWQGWASGLWGMTQQITTFGPF